VVVHHGVIKSPIAVLSLLIPAAVAMYVCGAVGVWYVWMVMESVVWLRGDGARGGQVFMCHEGKLRKSIKGFPNRS
jgi:hypothetical protein